ncbi:MAG TPA: metallophosphoesterase [Panacibacter sp.]|nr:metallophosphoesterase [Panacibacter sp.]HNP43507.1 metallophosphoesterase [Panacibacter sp.]
MSVSRRTFIELSFKTAAVISVANGLSSFSAESFTLPVKESIKLRFAIASDGHYGQQGTAYKSMHEEMLKWLNAESKGRGLDFTMINGDIFHNDLVFQEEVKTLWQRLAMPFYVSHGNHDNCTEAVWINSWNSPWHYTFEHNDTGFIVLNTADEKGTYICPDMAFAKQALQKMKDKQQLFVFMHITPLTWTKNGIDCAELVEYFTGQQNLKAVFHGHDHDQDAMKEQHGKFYFFDAHIAGNWGTDYRGYRIVEVLKSGEVITYQMNPLNGIQVNNNRIE